MRKAQGSLVIGPQQVVDVSSTLHRLRSPIALLIDLVHRCLEDGSLVVLSLQLVLRLQAVWQEAFDPGPEGLARRLVCTWIAWIEPVIPHCCVRIVACWLLVRVAIVVAQVLAWVDWLAVVHGISFNDLHVLLLVPLLSVALKAAISFDIVLGLVAAPSAPRAFLRALPGVPKALVVVSELRLV